jgi:exopolyphosphatase/guanosine-5'-triphosphate,3'-diphosphate pyrophosphatase
MRVSSVRTAGTSAIRRARADSDFIAEAEAALGHSIDVISGIEEARLIYSGVTHSIPPNDGLRLVLDIGGGSTELILGQGGEPQLLESLDLGCVSITERYFEGGKISREAFEKARTAARLQISPVQALFGVTKAIESVGTSGTIRSTLKVARELDFTDAHELDVLAVDRLIERVLDFDTISELSLPGLSERRAEVWPGGLAILAELLARLHIEALSVSDGALREGLLYDLLAQLQNSGAT